MPEPRKPARLAAADTVEAVDAFMASIKHPFKAEIESIRRTILGAAPGIHEGIKWNSPSFRTTEYFATVNLREKAGIGLILHLGAKVRKLPAGGVAIADPGKLLKWLGKDRAMVVFKDKNDLRAKKAGFAKIIEQWVAYV
jgi:hypothetical protein